MYKYIGPVYRFDKLVSEKIVLSTRAVSEGQALNNILFNVKKIFGYPAHAGGFKLTGNLKIE